MFDLNKKVIVVTGATGLLGQQHVEAILKFNGIPVLLDLNSESLKKKLIEISKDYPNIPSSV